ncbi:uncharacterized protein LOC132039104 [Lycium ferocissimum]|uniref:uncharacterized protein LOC132039104 n=1 Tax=Lycium ferocissimum TaxID=112874 RepID=UPI00281546EE|nr:uncharacterized protein LOC132039104 [Lycium ferocissimum]
MANSSGQRNNSSTSATAKNPPTGNANNNPNTRGSANGKAVANTANIGQDQLYGFTLREAAEASYDVVTDLMNRVFKPFLARFIIVFIDDILVYLKSREEHADHERITLTMLEENNLYIKFSKCEFFLNFVAFLDHMVSSEGFGGYVAYCDASCQDPT